MPSSHAGPAARRRWCAPIEGRLAVGVLLAVGEALASGCGGRRAPPPEPPPPPAAVAPPRTCADAAAGFESGTRSVRAPDSSVLVAIRAMCLDDAWPAAAIECFAMMTEREFGRCAGQLPVRSRDRMFATLGGGGAEEASDPSAPSLSLSLSLAKLQTLQIGIPACDAFVATVARVLVCERMSIAVRAQLGAETAEFWSLPTVGLPAGAQQKMADVCRRSQAVLEREAVAADCMP